MKGFSLLDPSIQNEIKEKVKKLKKIRKILKKMAFFYMNARF